MADEEEITGKAVDRKLIRRLLGYVRPYRWTVVFATIAAALQSATQVVGPYLNNENWINTVNNFGHIDNRGTGPYSSLRTGKYDADDNFQIVQFDSSLPPFGNWKAVTGLQDVPT